MSMRLLQTLVILERSKGFQDNCDDWDYNYIVFEYFMNYSLESLRTSYHKAKKQEQERVSDDLLLELGYSMDDVAGRTD